MGTSLEIPKLLDEYETGEALGGVAVPTLRQWRVERRGLPFVKIGGAVRYLLSDILEYLESRRVPVTK